MRSGRLGTVYSHYSLRGGTDTRKKNWYRHAADKLEKLFRTLLLVRTARSEGNGELWQWTTYTGELEVRVSRRSFTYEVPFLPFYSFIPETYRNFVAQNKLNRISMAAKPSIPKWTRDFSPVEMAKRNYRRIVEPQCHQAGKQVLWKRFALWLDCTVCPVCGDKFSRFGVQTVLRKDVPWVFISAMRMW